jgi:uncharacterized ferritin-like protein (DUF455 family)
MTSGSALRDRRSQSGAWLVKEMAQRLGAFRYLERECFRLLAGWMAVVPEWDVKLAFGKHVWEGAQHTERLGQRMVELRLPVRASRVPFILVSLIDLADRSTDTLQRLIAVYRVIKPLLATSYAELVNRTSAVSDAPTVDLLGELLARLERQIRWGESWIGELSSDPVDRERAVRWQLELEHIAVVTRDAIDRGVGDQDSIAAEPPQLSPRWVEGRPYQPKITIPARDERFRPLANIRFIDPDDDSPENLVSLMHLMTQSELGAAEVIGRLPYEHPEMPLEFHLNMARQTWDEVRHCEAAWKRLEALGGHLGMFPEKHGGHFERRMSLDLHHRLAAQGPIEEATANSSFKDFISRAIARGDLQTALLYDYIVADETTHVRFQSRWLAWLADQDVQKQRRWIAQARQLSEAWYDGAWADEDSIRQAKVDHFFNVLMGGDPVPRRSRAVERRPITD